jgi:DNA-binding NarL/FixJ family response regulator
LAYVDGSSRRAAQQCLTAGFVGAVSQGRGIEGLVEALTVARLGGIYVDQCFAPMADASPAAEAAGGEMPSRLSDRERFVLEHVARGFSNKEIAGKLALSAKTVETYRSRAASKLGLRRKSDIVQFALRSDWLSDRPDTM